MTQAKVAEKKSKKGAGGFFSPLWTTVASLILVVLFGIAFYQLYWTSTIIIDQIIAEQVDELAQVFQRIDKTCGIASFEHEKNYIDFLNVKSFVGSEVGPMNLKNPKKWEGPYAPDNPTIQEKYYVVIVTPDGYYVAPGDGVTLSNGLTIGKEILLNKDTNFALLTAEDGALVSRGRSLVRKFKDL